MNIALWNCGYITTERLRIDFTHEDIDEGSVVLARKTLTLDPTTSTECQVTIKGELCLLLNLGKDYNYGRSIFNASASVIIRAFNSTSISSTTLLWEINTDTDIEINHALTGSIVPEKIKCFPLENIQDIRTIEIEVIGWNSNAIIEDVVTLTAFVSREFDVEALGPCEIIRIPIAFWPTIFSWNYPCPETPNYQLQLLRLHNIAAEKTTEEDITAVVDWSKALTVETGSSKKYMKLTIAEGTGFYIWRVRPIGNKYPGGIANSANWGPWSDAPAQSSTIELNSSSLIPLYAFFYRQFDEDKNWIFTRTFTEDSKIAESISYANGLQQVQQNQKHLLSENSIIVNQTAYDFSGRPAVNSLPTPIVGTALGYVDSVMVHGGKIFSAVNFDSSGNYLTPEPSNAGRLHKYYSELNPDKQIPNAEGYGYTRKLYYKDGTSRLHQVSSVGDTLGIKKNSAESKTVTVYYSSVTEQELIFMFGDEAPSDTSVYKIITIDPNKTKNVTYINSRGDTIATCIAYSDTNIAFLDGLPARLDAAKVVVDTIATTTSCGENCLESTASIVATEPKTIILKYQILPGDVGEPCFGSCQTCDYNIYFTVQRTDEPDAAYPIVDTLIVSPGACSAEDSTWSKSYSLEPGSYVVTKRVWSRTKETVDSDPYITERVTELRRDLQERMNDVTHPIYEYIDDADLEGLYADPSVDVGDEVATFPAACCDDFEIPVMKCEPYVCPTIVTEVGTADLGSKQFGEYFDLFWAGEYDIATALSMYRDADGYRFNDLIENMISEGGYDLDTLCMCWETLTEDYGDMINDLSADADDGISEFDAATAGFAPSYNLLDQFLRCAGFNLEGLSSQEWDDTGYLSHAYKYVKCNRVPKACASLLPGIDMDPTDLPGTVVDVCAVDFTEFDFTEAEIDSILQNFYSCINSPPTVIDDAYDTPAEMQTKVEQGCEDVCEDRRNSFREEILMEYEEDGYTIQTEEGIKTDGGTLVTWATIECQVGRLVQHCKEGCQLTLFERPDTEDTDGDGDTAEMIVDSIGTGAEIAAMTHSMTSSFDIEFRRTEYGDTTCIKGYSLLDENVHFHNFLAAHLNRDLNAFIGKMESESAVFELGEKISDINEGCSGEETCRISGVSIYRDHTYNFLLKDCRLLLMDKWQDDFQIFMLCKNICSCLADCPPLCFKWEPIPTSFDTDGDGIDDDVYSLDYTTCEKQSGAYLKQLIEGQVHDCIEEKVTALKAEYRNRCLNNINELFTISDTLSYFQYTLFYYDRTGNLVRTVQPKGVDLVETRVHPDHSFVTEYEYNSLGQKVKATTPDGGVVIYHYDDFGQLRFSQNEKQIDENKYSFVIYDNIGRIKESGESVQLAAGPDDHLISGDYFADYVNEQNYPNDDHQKTDFVEFTYTERYGSSLDGRKQRFLQNRISYTQRTVEDSDDEFRTIYSYDHLGNVEWLVQDVPGLGRKFIDYEYDLISGNVKLVDYNRNDATERFLHRYSYDADNRLIQVETSRDSIIWDRDARYEFYKHGPLRRIVLGEDKAQGIDYTYTIQGWLKGINHPALEFIKDPGKDGLNTGANAAVGKDAFGMILNYFDGDFNRTPSPYEKTDGQHLSPEFSLYNGNITNWITQIDSLSPTGTADPPADHDLKFKGLVASEYKYDELYRLTADTFMTYKGGWVNTPRSQFNVHYAYDPNGNITKMQRNAFIKTHPDFPGRSPHPFMDSLNYQYRSHGGIPTNQLDFIADTVSEGLYDTDLDNQTSGNYVYDKTGNLTKDIQAGLDSIYWTSTGKVEAIAKTNDDSIVFYYDASDYRIRKEFFSDPEMIEPEPELVTHYIRDAGGRILSIYEETDEITQKEVPIYGTDRLGIYKPDDEPEEFSRVLDKKEYELKDHLGNVRVTISDIKLPDASVSTTYIPINFSADLKAYYNYYPYGSAMPERDYNAAGYRFGFNGMEKDDEVKGTGSSYTTEFRQYDPRLGKWLSIEPLFFKFPHISAYAFTSNNPINYFDPTGKEFSISMQLSWGIRKAVAKMYNKPAAPMYKIPHPDYKSLQESGELVLWAAPAVAELTTFLLTAGGASAFTRTGLVKALVGKSRLKGFTQKGVETLFDKFIESASKDIIEQLAKEGQIDWSNVAETGAEKALISAITEMVSEAVLKPFKKDVEKMWDEENRFDYETKMKEWLTEKGFEIPEKLMEEVTKGAIEKAVREVKTSEDKQTKE